MISTTTSTVATAGIAAMGLWANDQKIGVKFVVGTGVFAVGLAILGEANATFAEQFGLLILATAFLIYAVPVAQKLGLIQKKGGLSGLGSTISNVLGA